MTAVCAKRPSRIAGHSGHIRRALEQALGYGRLLLSSTSRGGTEGCCRLSARCCTAEVRGSNPLRSQLTTAPVGFAGPARIRLRSRGIESAARRLSLAVSAAIGALLATILAISCARERTAPRWTTSRTSPQASARSASIGSPVRIIRGCVGCADRMREERRHPAAADPAELDLGRSELRILRADADVAAQRSLEPPA